MYNFKEHNILKMIHTFRCRVVRGDQVVPLQPNDRHFRRSRRRLDADECAMNDAMSAGRAWHGRGRVNDVHDGRKHEVSAKVVYLLLWNACTFRTRNVDPPRHAVDIDCYKTDVLLPFSVIALIVDSICINER